MFAFTILKTYTEEVDELSIKIIDGGYEVTNVYDDCTTTITYTNFGTTDVGFDADSVLEFIEECETILKRFFKELRKLKNGGSNV